MTLRLYDTNTRSIRDFTPLRPGQASIYLCGPTVQAPPHVGHVRSMVNFDILRRWLERGGHRVTFCQNITDIEDKVLARAGQEGVPFWVVAQRNERAFAEAYDALGCQPPTVAPRASGHVPEMITLIRRLVDRGHAYPAGGDVYFDVSSWPEYGTLSGQRPDQMHASEEHLEPAKRRPEDFTLWKGAKPGEPFWDTPWGPGRPGWHLECSAMAERYLGPAFDIHGGGLDLVFPHHENEIAQSEAAGDPFASYWLHNGLVTLAGEKMSKSLGNSLLVTRVCQRVRPVELRYFLGAAHYRSTIEYSEEALAEAVAAYRRLEGFIRRAAERVGEPSPAGLVPEPFAQAMDDDLGVPQALAVVHNAVRQGNTALADGDHATVGRTAAEVRTMLGVLGLDPFSPAWRERRETGLREVVDALVSVALEQRTAARARRDYAAADAIRDRLAAAGVLVEDTPDGPRWTLRDEV
ncbi:MAG TPA: cysteine--tRNA ligase [Mycobacteriales bacterium]|nr:cysteine--tRNA ligase [Mycobacteriales bacterium]